eukprot:scaffold321268_cov42-Prasinocladus_malaysianus.AAC.1
MQAPWLLAILDLIVHVTLYCFAPNSLLERLVIGTHYHYSFRTAAEDIIFVMLARVAAVSLTSYSGVDRFRRQELMTAPPNADRQNGLPGSGAD